MARRRKPLSVEDLVREIDRQLALFAEDVAGLTLREKVLRLVQLRGSVCDLGVTVAVDHGLSKTNALDRIRVYFEENVGAVLAGEELAVVSGISEYGRRIRQLRVEMGYRILSGASPDANSGVELLPDQYVLVSRVADSDAARRWVIANRIRRSRAGSKDRVLHFLKENVGRIVTTEDLAYVAKGAKEFARRVRELRTEDGYAVSTRLTGRPDLGMGEYVLSSAERLAEPHDRNISLETQREVYARDSNTCRVCGWDMSKWNSANPRILELHHLKPHVNKGRNTPDNLIVICSRCHDGVHAGRVKVRLAKA